MAYRYCPEHDAWLETADYTVDESGEMICPEHDIAVHGYIDGHIDTVGKFKEANMVGRSLSDEIEAAKRQGLLHP